MDFTNDLQLDAAAQQSPNFINPAYITPEQVANLRATATQLLANQPEAKSWAGVLGALANAWGSSRLRDQAAALDQQRLEGSARQYTPAGGAQGGGMLPAIAQPQAGGGASSSAGDLASYYAPTLGNAGAAGLVGGFGAESGFRTTAVGDSGTSAGLGQWHDSPGDPRHSNEVAFARKYGMSPNDSNAQRQFALVEMGLSGSPDDPGFGTERSAGQALRAARTPQEATAAALMYERPGGYSPQHPENSNGYSRRLALASALMGQGGAPMAYAAGSPQPGAGVPWPAQRPQMAPGAGGQPAPVQMAQNAPLGAQGGMPPDQLAHVLVNPNVPEWQRAELQRQYTPQPFTDATGGVHYAVPGRLPAGGTPGQSQVAPGMLTGAISGGSVPAYQPTIGGLPTGQTAFPGSGGAGVGAPAAAGAATGMPTTIAGWQQYWRDQQALQAQQEQALTTMGKSAAAVPQYRGALSVIDLADKAADNIEDIGTITKLKAFAQEKTGLPIGDNLSSIDTFRALVNNLQTQLPPGVAGISPEVLGRMTTTPEGRHQILANLHAMIQYGLELGQVGGDFEGIPKTSDRWKKYQSLTPPQPTWSLPQKGAPAPAQGGAPAAQGAPAGAPASAAGAAAPQTDRLAEARAAIAKGAPRDAVIKRLRERGIDPTGL